MVSGRTHAAAAQRALPLDDPAVVQLFHRAPAARSAAATVAIRSDSFTRSSRAPRISLRPFANAASTATIGSSSIRRGASSSATVTGRRPPAFT